MTVVFSILRLRKLQNYGQHFLYPLPDNPNNDEKGYENIVRKGKILVTREFAISKNMTLNMNKPYHEPNRFFCLEISVVWLPLKPLLHRYSFLRINNSQFLKTLREKEKLLVTSNFSFSHNVFYSIKYLYPHLSFFF